MNPSVSILGTTASQHFLILVQCVPHEVVHIDLSDKPKWFRQLCKDEALPSTVPAIDYKGCAKTDSLEISR